MLTFLLKDYSRDLKLKSKKENEELNYTWSTTSDGWDFNFFMQSLEVTEYDQVNEAWTVIQLPYNYLYINNIFRITIAEGQEKKKSNCHW